MTQHTQRKFHRNSHKTVKIGEKLKKITIFCLFSLIYKPTQKSLLSLLSLLRICHFPREIATQQTYIFYKISLLSPYSLLNRLNRPSTDSQQTLNTPKIAKFKSIK